MSACANLSALPCAEPQRWPVLVWAEDVDRRRTLFSVLETLPSLVVHQADNWDQLPSLEAAVVVLGLSAKRTGDSDLQRIRTLKNSVAVICLLDDLGEQDVALICRFLLAGVKRIIDAQSKSFASQLRSVVGQAAKQALASQLEQEDLQGTMSRVGFVGRSPAILHLFRSVRNVSHLTDLPVLITGETGTGKELVAQAIHVLDAKRSSHSFVSVNCAALTEQISESELFGHQKGSFTGADRDRNGLFRTANRGVLFLDEVGELSTALQTKLLRVLQTNRVRSVGADREVIVDVRVISATNRPLDQMVKTGLFREDLFHRLNVLSLHIPPLRERHVDIPALVQHFVEKHSSIWAGASQPSVSPDFVQALEGSALQGNARQLENLVRRAMVASEGIGPLSVKDLPQEIWQELSVKADLRDPQPMTQSAMNFQNRQPLEDFALEYLQKHNWNLVQALHGLESVLVRGALRAFGGNQSEAARHLGITARSVYNKLHNRLAS